MRAKTNISQLIDGITPEKLQYNTEIIKILSDKTILAWILKYAVEEFMHCGIEEIRECIEGTPEIHTRKVLPGKTPESITGMNTADLVLDEGESYFDIYFYAYPPEGEKTKIIINVEVAKDTINNIALEDLKGINDGGLIHIEPNIKCYSNEVVANHLTTIGCLDKDMINYLMSKGISSCIAKTLLKKGFIYSNINKEFFGGD